MKVFSRRKFLARTTIAAAAVKVCSIPVALAQSSSQAQMPPDHSGWEKIPLQVNWDKPVTVVPENMLGLSYEATQLSATDFFSEANTQLVTLFKRLSPNGVLRLGGNLSEYTRWAPDAPAEKPAVSFRAVGADPGKKVTAAPSPVSKQSILHLKEFLDQTGWSTVYGLNLAFADPARITAEAHFVHQTLGEKLIAFQIGNEPDHYVMNGLRKAGYSFRDYFAEWMVVHDAVQKAVPHAWFAGPDIAEATDWVAEFAKVAPKSVILLTGHYYAEGPPTNPAMTMERLLRSSTVGDQRVSAMKGIAEFSKLPCATAETNSCFNAGKQGVSDVFGAAVWAVDYIAQLCAAKECGVYFHGGANGWYTPIAGGSGAPFTPRPIYSGLLMFRELLGSPMVQVLSVKSDVNLTVYGFQSPRRILAVNKDSRDITLVLHAGGACMRVKRLRAASLEERQDIALEEVFNPRDPVGGQNSLPTGALELLVPRHSAAIFEIVS